MAKRNREHKGYRTFKSTYKNREGQTRQTAKWYIEFRDHNETIRRLPAFTSKAASEEMARNIVKLVGYYKASGGQVDFGLTTWLETLPTKVKLKLCKIGLLQPQRLINSKTLREHIADFESSMQARGRNRKHIRLTVGKIVRVCTACNFQVWTDVSADRVEHCLLSLREQDNGIGQSTFNAYVVALKSIGNWMVENGRATISPLRTLQKLTVTDSEERRALTVEEARKLLRVTETAPDRYGLSGHERSLIYRLAIETGLRSSELKSLKVESFDFDCNPACVCVARANTKNKQAACLELSSTTSELIRQHLMNKMPGTLAFNMPASTHTAEMLRADLEDAAIPATDEAGRVLVFHSLRHTRGVWLFEHYKAHPREVQELMRLSDRYTKSFRLTDTTLIERGPDLSPSTELDSAKCTGTNSQPVLASCLAQQCTPTEPRKDSDRHKNDKNPKASKAVNPAYHRRKALKTSTWARLDSNQRRHKPADLQSAPFVHFGTRPFGHD